MSRALENKKTLGLPGMQEITELARLLRNSGDRVLSASSKLSLSIKLLHDLNEAFSLIINETDDLESSFQVCNSSRNEVFRDIKFLHDFVQKTIGLKIQYNSSDTKIDVDITKFRHLKYLELHKVSVDSVKGIQGIRGQVECIVCSGGRGVNNVRELLAACGGDAGAGFVWGSLRRLALPYNGLTQLDSSLEYVPYLETIDLSHNIITKASELECIPNLRNVNLGYNNLECVPQFSRTSYRTLQKLVLKNNYIDQIDGLDGLECLTELDLSYNCLTEHATLWPLETMSMLAWVCLDGNPLAYHPRHRLHTIKHLHPSLSDSKFVLDTQPLSKSERLFVSENRLFSLHVAMRRRAADSSSSLTSSLGSSWAKQSLTSTSGMPKSRSADAGLAEASVVIEAPAQQQHSRSSGSKRRRGNVREAVIAEDELDREKPARPSSLSTSYLESSTDHLETKRQILALRAKYGEEHWLSGHTASYIQSIMGLEATPVASSTNGLLSSTLDVDVGRPEPPIAKDTAGLSPIPSGPVEQQRAPENGESRDQPRPEPKGPEYESTDEGIVIETEPENETEEQAGPKPEAPETTENAYDPEEEEGDLYLVHKKKGLDDYDMIFLIITSEDIKERDSLTGKIKYRWATNTVLSCVMGREIPTTIDITFDTMRRDREARTYFAELEDAKKIVQTLNEMIKTQPMMLKVFKCMKCSTHFSHDSDSNVVIAQTAGVPPKCPTCKSTLVIQTDDLPTPTVEAPTKYFDKTKAESQMELTSEPRLPHSNSQSSIGGTEGGARSIATSLVHCDSHPQAQICCSATSLEDSRESTPSAGMGNKKYESDIEVLSNPSQSSIEVLDDGSKAAGKLPEKSELSGSRAEEARPEEPETGFAAMTNLTSMLGELLHSMKIGTSKDTMSRSEESSEFVGSSIQYSYTDFSNVDHRIKLHIILNVFEQENEELALLLRADILTRSSTDTFPGCLVISTAKVYILKVTGPEGEDPQRWLHKEASWTIDRLRSFAPLPFKQGVLVELEQPIKPGESLASNVVVCILQDFQRTSNFLFYLTDSPLPAGCEVEFTVPQHCTTSMKDILKSSKSYKPEDPVRLLALFSSAVLKLTGETVKLKVSSLIITSSSLIVTQDKVNWLLPENSKLPAIAAEQAMSNLIEVDFSGSQLTLSFLDEVAGAEANWQLSLVSPSAAEAVINSIRPPWEELFSVPLQVDGSGAGPPAERT